MAGLGSWHYSCFAICIKHLFILLFVLLALTGCSPEQRLESAIDDIGRAASFMGSAVGITGSKPSVYKDYETVLELASPDQLREMVSDNRASVRIYGFQGMVETNHPETFTAFQELLPDTTILSTMGGCIVSSERINSLAARLLTDEYSRKDFFQLKGRERIAFDSFLLFSGHLPLERWTAGLENVAPVSQHYEAIKKLALDSSSVTAKMGLANFQREDDLDFLQQQFSLNDPYDYAQTMEIISRFPHPSYLPYLKDAQQKLLESVDDYYDFMDLYITVFQYPPDTVQLFLEVLENHPDENYREAHLQGAWMAAQLNSNPAKRKLAKSIVIDDYLVHNLAYLQGVVKYANHK